ncbi:PorT family protein [bacterium]|nr:PorT family protein [bacterium]
MKRNIFISVMLTMLIVLIFGTAFGQLGIRKGIKGGYNWAKLSSDSLNNIHSIKSLTGGISLEFNILNLLSLQTDVLYSPRGSLVGNNVEIKLKYLSIPVILKRKFFPVGIHPYLLIGPEINFLLSASRDGADIKNMVNQEDFALVTGGGVEFSFLGKGAYIEGRYSYGLNSIYSDAVSQNSKNRVYQIFGGFLL